MKKTLCLLATLALLVACSSPVKLNEVPVEDKAGTQVAAAAAAAPAPAPPPARSAVATVDARPLAAVPRGPAGVAIPTSVAAVSTTWRWAKSVQRLCARHSICWVSQMDKLRRSAWAKKSPPWLAALKKLLPKTAGLRSPTNDEDAGFCNPWRVAVHCLFIHGPSGLV